MNLPFAQWWFRGYFKYPPHPNDIMQLPVGEKAMTELSCDKDATSWWQSGPGGNRQDTNNPDYPCPGQPTTQFHTNGINDLGGCVLAVAYKSDVNDVQPEDFVVFSVNQTCVWNLHTYFEVPADMPPCPNDKCTCAWFWVHRADSGSEQSGFIVIWESCSGLTESRLYDWLPMQLRERCFDEEASDTQSSASVRGCRNPPVFASL